MGRDHDRRLASGELADDVPQPSGNGLEVACREELDEPRGDGALRN